MQFSLVLSDYWIDWTSPAFIYAMTIVSFWLLGFAWLMRTGEKYLFRHRPRSPHQKIFRILGLLLLGSFIVLIVESDIKGAPALALIIVVVIGLAVLLNPKFQTLKIPHNILLFAVYLYIVSSFQFRLLIQVLSGSSRLFLPGEVETADLHVLDVGYAFLIMGSAFFGGWLLGRLSERKRIRLPGDRFLLSSLMHFFMPGWGLAYLGFPFFGLNLMILEFLFYFSALLLIRDIFGISGLATALGALLPHCLITVCHYSLRKQIIKFRQKYFINDVISSN